MAAEGADTPTPESTRALVRRWVEAYNNHDVDAFRDLLAENYEEIGPSGTISGRAAALADLLDTFTSQPDCAISVTALVADAKVAAVEYQMQATMAAPAHLPNGRVVPGTGQRYDMSGCSLVSVEGNQITGVHHYYDRALMREQLGLPASGAPIGAN
jgi:steroid delta-isomerase-like uncharacterized protein